MENGLHFVESVTNAKSNVVCVFMLQRYLPFNSPLKCQYSTVRYALQVYLASPLVLAPAAMHNGVQASFLSLLLLEQPETSNLPIRLLEGLRIVPNVVLALLDSCLLLAALIPDVLRASPLAAEGCVENNALVREPGSKVALRAAKASNGLTPLAGIERRRRR